MNNFNKIIGHVLCWFFEKPQETGNHFSDAWKSAKFKVPRGAIICFSVYLISCWITGNFDLHSGQTIVVVLISLFCWTMAEMVYNKYYKVNQGA